MHCARRQLPRRATQSSWPALRPRPRRRARKGTRCAAVFSALVCELYELLRLKPPNKLTYAIVHMHSERLSTNNGRISGRSRFIFAVVLQATHQAYLTGVSKSLAQSDCTHTLLLPHRRHCRKLRRTRRS